MPTDDLDDDRARGLKQKVTHKEYAQLIQQSDVYYDPHIYQYKSNKHNNNNYLVNIFIFDINH